MLVSMGWGGGREGGSWGGLRRCLGGQVGEEGDWVGHWLVEGVNDLQCR